jgi:hypothetical protein
MSLPSPLASPNPYVQWRRPGEEEWHNYDYWSVPWDAETLEMRLLPRPDLTTMPPDSIVMHMAHEGPAEYRASYIREHTVSEYRDDNILLELPTLREGTYEITVIVEKQP